MSPQERGAHTPSPWEAVYSVGEWIIKSARGKYIGGLMIGGRECRANARLIAAAPDYHEGTGRILARHDAEAVKANFARCGCEVCATLRPIYAKATGARP